MSREGKCVLLSRRESESKGGGVNDGGYGVVVCGGC